MATSKTAEGFFKRDEDIGVRMDEYFEEGEQWVALECDLEADYVTGSGQTLRRTRFLARKLDPDTLTAFGVPVTVKTASNPIREAAERVAPGDFPAVVAWHRVPVSRYDTEAVVLRRVTPWPIPDDYRDPPAASEG